MGTEVDLQEFSRSDRTRHREKVRRCLDVFARMLRESYFDIENPMTGMEIEFNLVDDEGRPALKSAEALEAIANPHFQTELAQFNLEINVLPRRLGLARRLRLRGRPAQQPEPRREQGQRGPRPHGDDRDPADPRGRPPEPLERQPEPALQAAQRPDPGGARRGPRHRHPGHRAAADDLRLDHAGGRLHEHPAAHPGEPGQLRGVLERLAGDQRHPARGRRQLAVPPRQAAVAGDPDPPVRAGHRHPQRGAQGAGRAAAGVVRRALDQLDLRPVRGERPLLPGAAPDHRRRGPARGARERRHPDRSRSSSCTTAPSTAGTGRCTTWSRASRTCGSRTACSPPARRVIDTMANAAFYFGLVRTLAEDDRPLWSQMSFSAAEENFHVAARARHRRARVLAGHRRGRRDRAGAAPAAADGPRGPGSLGRRARRGGRGCSGSSSSAACSVATAPPGTSTR